MDSLLTQGLIGLVFVLSVALWAKSSSSSSLSDSSTSRGVSSSQKSKKKKKKGNTTQGSSATLAAPAASRATVPSIVVEPPSAAISADKPAEVGKTKPKPQVNGISNGGKKGASAASRKKMTLEDFTAKTNEERVEELERAARGDAGEKDLGGDMIDKDLQPERSYKKIARIEPAASTPNRPTRSAEDGWENVGGKAKISQPLLATPKSNNAVPSNAWASSNPFALLPGSGAEPMRVSSVHISPKTISTSSTSSNASAAAAAAAAAQAQTKRQRQNAAKTQAKKAEKEAIEAERLARLAQHKKQVEGERVKEFLRKQGSNPTAPFSVHHNGTSKAASTTLPRASINEKGSLVWD